MKTTQAEWTHIRQAFLDGISRRGTPLTLRDRVWAVTRSGEWIALPGATDSPVPDRWWLGVDPEKVRTRRPLGIVLLCRTGDAAPFAIGLPRTLLDELEPKLSRNAKQAFLNVARRGTRFFLQLRGGEEIDVTGHLDDISWIAPGTSTAQAYHPTPDTHAIAREAPEPASSVTRFFAVVKDGALYPLDEVHLEPGSLHLVEARTVPSVPGNRSVRRILARGGPADLPADFAEQHDHYAHGAHRR